jgi:hypothetical protein
VQRQKPNSLSYFQENLKVPWKASRMAAATSLTALHADGFLPDSYSAHVLEWVSCNSHWFPFFPDKSKKTELKPFPVKQP